MELLQNTIMPFRQQVFLHFIRKTSWKDAKAFCFMMKLEILPRKTIYQMHVNFKIPSILFYILKSTYYSSLSPSEKIDLKNV